MDNITFVFLLLLLVSLFGNIYLGLVIIEKNILIDEQAGRINKINTRHGD